MKFKLKETVNRIIEKIKTSKKQIIEGSVSLGLVLALIVCSTFSAWSLNDSMAISQSPSTGEYEVLNYNPSMRRTAAALGASVLCLSALSVELDLAITVTNSENAVVTGIPFEFKITQSNNSSNSITAVDDDMDGQVYITGLAEGAYNVELLAAAGVASPVSTTVEVQPKVSYVQLDVSKKVVTEKDVNVAEEDKQYSGTGNSGATTTTPTIANTVEYVASSSTVKENKTETPVTDESGNQIIKYKPSVSADGYLLLASGAASTISVTLDADGYLLKAERLDVGGEVEPSAAAEEPPAEVVVAEPTLTDVTSEVISNLSLYKLVAVPQVTVTVETTTVYYGWQTFSGKSYYYDKNGNKVTGWQIIDGVNYFFDADGARGGGSNGNLGIDVSTYQETIDWAKVKAAGIDFAFIRVGYRGYTKGSLILDSHFKRNIAGATGAGLKVGVYFFTQAITEAEAVEEASMCLQYIKGYNVNYPIVIDVEEIGGSAGRANSLTTAQRTKVVTAFCETIKNAGYTPAVYANKNYLETKLYTSTLEANGYVIWLAHYTSGKSSYSGRYELWQYSSSGTVNGINGKVDMNLSYLGY